MFLRNMLRARKYRFGLCFWLLSKQYIERTAYANIFKCKRETKRFERAKVNSRCFHWFPALVSLRGAPTWGLHTNHYNFQWYPWPNSSISEHRISLKLWHVVYLSLFCDISFFWLNLLNGKRDFISHLRETCLIKKPTCMTWKPPIIGRMSRSQIYCFRISNSEHNVSFIAQMHNSHLFQLRLLSVQQPDFCWS